MTETTFQPISDLTDWPDRPTGKEYIFVFTDCNENALALSSRRIRNEKLQFPFYIADPEYFTHFCVLEFPEIQKTPKKRIFIVEGLHEGWSSKDLLRWCTSSSQNMTSGSSPKDLKFTELEEKP